MSYLKRLMLSIVLLIPLSACLSTPPPKPLDAPLIAPPDAEAMISPTSDDIPELPPPEARTSRDYELAYLALLSTHTTVATRLALLQSWARRVTAPDE